MASHINHLSMLCVIIDGITFTVSPVDVLKHWIICCFTFAVLPPKPCAIFPKEKLRPFHWKKLTDSEVRNIMRDRIA